MIWKKIQKNIPSRSNGGFSLVELVVAVAVFTVISISIYSSYTTIFSTVFLSNAKLDAVDLVNEQLEIVRNLPYADVGISGGIPAGVLPHTQTLVRDGITFNVTITVRNTDDPFDGTLGGTPNDLSPADFKTVEVEINCASCKNFKPVIVTTRVAPKNLETASTNGALFVRVFDANGDPISDADVHISNTQVVPNITVDDVTNVSGMLQVVDAPPGANAYDITVTKSGFTSDGTYPATISNPNPVKPFATVALQQVTQVSFIIDRLSSLNINSVTQTCSPVGNISFNLLGAKLIGKTPDVIKYNTDLSTNGSGILNLSNLEWDSYSFTVTDTGYDLIGINPIPPINLLPNSSQNMQLVVAPKNSRTLLVAVKDSGTSLPLSGVIVTISKSGFTDVIKSTGEGFLSQTDWSGGDGQATSTDLTKFFSSDGNISTDSPVGDLFLNKVSDDYALSGVITSSSFDTGSISNFQKILWTPISQPAESGIPNVRLQIATNNNGGTWDYAGPDGTASTYYTTSNQNINSINNGNRYLRYKLFLDTAGTSTSPNISDVSFTFTSDCTPPGQVYFSGLPSGTYNLNFSKSGYVDQDISVDVNSSWQMQEVVMLPS